MMSYRKVLGRMGRWSVVHGREEERLGVTDLDDVSEKLVHVPVRVQHFLPLRLDAHRLALHCRERCTRGVVRRKERERETEGEERDEVCVGKEARRGEEKRRRQEIKRVEDEIE